jgi:hypothetical protein
VEQPHRRRPVQVRQSLLAAGYTIRLDFSKGHVFAVDSPSGSSGGSGGGGMVMMKSNPLRTGSIVGRADPGDLPGTNISAAPPQRQRPTFAIPTTAGAASHIRSMATAAAIRSLSALPGIARVQPDRRIYLLDSSRQGLEAGPRKKQRQHREQREQQQQHRRLEALRPQNVCPSLPYARAVGGGEEYNTYGVAAVQALDPVLIEASKNISSKVGLPPARVSTGVHQAA